MQHVDRLWSPLYCCSGFWAFFFGASCINFRKPPLVFSANSKCASPVRLCEPGESRMRRVREPQPRESASGASPESARGEKGAKVRRNRESGKNRGVIRRLEADEKSELMSGSHILGLERVEYGVENERKEVHLISLGTRKLGVECLSAPPLRKRRARRSGARFVQCRSEARMGAALYFLCNAAPI